MREWIPHDFHLAELMREAQSPLGWETAARKKIIKVCLRLMLPEFGHYTASQQVQVILQ